MTFPLRMQSIPDNYISGASTTVSCTYMDPTSTIGIYTSDMQGMVWGEPELSHMWVFDHMVFFQS